MDLEVGDLVLDHVIEDLSWSEEQPPVEAHRPVGRAAGPAGALATDLQAAVARAGAGDGGVQAPGHLVARLTAKPTLKSVVDRLPARKAYAHPQGLPEPCHVWTHSPALDPHVKAQPFAQVGDLPAVLETGRRVFGLGLGHSPQRALDPLAFLLHEGLDLPQRQAARHHHLHPVRGHLDAGAPGAVGAADAVGNGRHTLKIRFEPDLVNRKSPILPVLLGALAVGLLALAFALANSSDTEDRSSGPAVRVTPAGGGFSAAPGEYGAVLAVKALRPGQSTIGAVRVRNSGTSAGLVTFSRTGLSDRPGPNGGRLSERLELEVLDVTEPSNPKIVYTGGVAPLDTRPLGVLAPGAQRRYEVRATALKGQTATVPLGGGDAYEGSTTRITFRWRAIEGLPPTRLASLLRPVDSTGPEIRLFVAPRQEVIRSGQLRGRLRCSEPCRASATATVPVGPRQRLEMRGPKGIRSEHPLLLAFPRGTQNALRGTLEAGRTVAMKLRFQAADRTGNRSTLTETLRLQPRRR